MTFFGRAGVLWLLVIVPPCLGQVLHAPRDCSYEGKAWTDGSYRVTGDICQRCDGGGWVQRTNRPAWADPKCSAPDPPGEGNNLQIDRADCGANSATASSRHALRLDADKCLECFGGDWREMGPASYCKAPRLIIPRQPTLSAPYSDGPNGALLVGERLMGSIQGKQFLNAEALIDATAKSKERMADGQWVGSKLLIGYSAALKNSGRWDEQLALISTGLTTVDLSAHMLQHVMIIIAGGLIGYNAFIGSTVTNSYATGAVSLTNNSSSNAWYGSSSYAGGLIGYNGFTGGTITNSYATGGVNLTFSNSSGYASAYAGGLIGQNFGSAITNCCWRTARTCSTGAAS